MKEKNTKWTPGPWKVIYFEEADNPLPCGIDAKNYSVVEFGIEHDEPGGIRNLADAHLIAAAPELYKALDRARAMLLYYHSVCGPRPSAGLVETECEAALKKARGE